MAFCFHFIPKASMNSLKITNIFLTLEQYQSSALAKKQIKDKHQSFMETFDEYDKKEKKNFDDLPWIDLDIMLNDFNWKASGDASALEARLISELQALEKANVHDIIQSEERANSVVQQIQYSLKELTHIDEWLITYTRLLEVINFLILVYGPRCSSNRGSK